MIYDEIINPLTSEGEGEGEEEVKPEGEAVEGAPVEGAEEEKKPEDEAL